MQAPSYSTIALLVLLPLLAWRVYARFRRMVGRQRLSRVRPWITLAIFPALVLLLCVSARAHPERLWWLAGGLGVGAALALPGLRMTRFEPTPQGLFYTPNAHLGIALSLLFIGRVLYRLVEVYVIDPAAPRGASDFARSPLTLAVFGLLAGYYIAYAIGLAKWRYRVLRAKRERESMKSAIASANPGGGTIGATAVELSVYAPGGVRSALQGAAAAFERETGHTVKFTFGTGGGIQKQVSAGAPADVAVLPSAGADELEIRGLVARGGRIEVGSVGIGVGIKAGMPRPRIDTVEEFRDALLAAGSITYADPARGGTSGTYFADVVLPRLGIAEQVRAKTALTGVGEEAVRRVASGESELVIVQASEIMAVPGAEIAGMLPKSIQSEIRYSAVALNSSKAAEVAGTFVRFLVAPSGSAAFKAAGFEVPPQRQGP